MNPIHSFLGRRQFLIAFVSTTLALAFGRVAKAFDFVFGDSAARASDRSGSGEKKVLKAVVVYHSSTGATAKVANAIYRGMNKVMHCDVAPVKKIKPEDMQKYDVMAIGGPIWLHREPANLKVFTAKMPRMDGKYLVLFTTHGTQPFSIFWTMSRNLVKRGMTIIGWNDWYGDATHVLHSRQPYVTWGHPDEIDLQEAETFGKEIAERAQQIADGEKGLIPEIPTPGGNEQSLWSPHVTDGHLMYGGLPPSRPGGPDPMEVPIFDLKKCVYPRCTQCMDNCPVNAIDISMATPSAYASSPLVVKNACQHCGALCQRVCYYDAISYIGEKTLHAVDMTKCIYPKCTLCADECLMDAIDFSQDPPVVHDRCEGCDVCWCICPVEGASVITNMEKSQYLHVPTSDLPADIVKKYNLQDPPGGAMPMPEAGSGPLINSSSQMGQIGGARGESGSRNGEGGAVGAPGGSSPQMGQDAMMPKFRRLVPNDEQRKKIYPGLVMLNPNIPRIVLNKADWPYDVKEG